AARRRWKRATARTEATTRSEGTTRFGAMSAAYLLNEADIADATPLRSAPSFRPGHKSTVPAELGVQLISRAVRRRRRYGSGGGETIGRRSSYWRGPRAVIQPPGRRAGRSHGPVRPACPPALLPPAAGDRVPPDRGPRRAGEPAGRPLLRPR